jgi:membrane fusion protein
MTDSSEPLFRHQVLDGARNAFHGEILLTRPVSFSIITFLFVGIASSLVLFVATFGFARKAHVSGVIMPTGGLIRLVAGQAGVIVERRVEEGQAVAAGDPLFVLSSARFSATLGDADSTISELLQERRKSLVAEQGQSALQWGQRIEATTRRVEQFTAEAERVASQVALQEQRIGLATTALQRYRDLADVSYISRAQLQDKTADLIDQQQRLHDLERARSTALRDLSAARAELRDQQSQVRRDAMTLERSISSTEQEFADNEAKRRIVVRTPQAGQIAAVTAESGQTVGATQTLASLVPEGSVLEGELLIPSRSIGFLKPGQQVLVRYQAFPYQKFGQYRGKVREISRTAMRAEEISTLLPGTISTNEPMYRARIELEKSSVIAYGAEQPLRPGMLLEASIVLDERKIYEWVLEPLLGISEKIRS